MLYRYLMVSQCSMSSCFFVVPSKPSVPRVLKANIKTRANTWSGVS